MQHTLNKFDPRYYMFSPSGTFSNTMSKTSDLSTHFWILLASLVLIIYDLLVWLIKLGFLDHLHAGKPNLPLQAQNSPTTGGGLHDCNH
jgi:hypothetical protein